MDEEKQYLDEDEPDEDEDENEDEDEERDYRFRIHRAVGPVGPCHSDPVTPWCESFRQCRPSELQDCLEQWASEVTVEVAPLAATYWLVCRAYLVYPWTRRSDRSDHGLPAAESTIAIPPQIPPCKDYMADCAESKATHNWRFADPSVLSVYECVRCGLRREHHEPTSSWPWSWVNYERSGEVDEEERIS